MAIKKQQRQKQESYPEEKNPFGEEKNGYVAKEKKKKKKKIEEVKGKKGRALSNAISDLVAEDDNKRVPKTSQASMNHFRNSPSSIPAYLRTHQSSSTSQKDPRTDTSSSTTHKDPRCRKKTSEGDIKTLHQKPAKRETLNPFEEIEEVEPNNNPPEHTKTHHITRKHRAASIVISSRDRKKKKRMKIIKKFKKKKAKKEKSQKEEPADNLTTYNPKPEKTPEDNTVKMRLQVEEVTGVVSERVAKHLIDRQSKISELLESTGELERFSEQFAKNAHEIVVTKKAKTRCCGMFSKYRFCRYLCACTMPFRKHKKKNSPTRNEPPTSRAFADLYDDDEPYGVSETSLLNSPAQSEKSGKQSNGFLRAVQKSPLLQKPVSENGGSRNSLRAIVQRSKIFQNFSETKSRKHTSGSRLRATSSMGDLSDLLQGTPKLDKEIRRSIALNIQQYEDEDTRRRAAQLLLLDHN